MEVDRELYKRAFSRVKASPEKIQEVIDMTENQKTKKTARRMLVAVAVTALALLTAMGANAASGGQLFTRIVSYTQSADGCRTETVVEADDGSTQEDGAPKNFTIHQEGEDGKAVVTYWDESGREIQEEIDLDQASGAMAPVLWLDGQEMVLESTELDGKTAAVTCRDAEGREAKAVLELPGDCQGFGSLAELLEAKGTVSGRTQDGRSYKLAKGE